MFNLLLGDDRVKLITSFLWISSKDNRTWRRGCMQLLARIQTLAQMVLSTDCRWPGKQFGDVTVPFTSWFLASHFVLLTREMEMCGYYYFIHSYRHVIVFFVKNLYSGIKTKKCKVQHSCINKTYWIIQQIRYLDL